jgi:acetyl-CoA carboxylase biotin carboxyl carrier protein
MPAKQRTTGSAPPGTGAAGHADRNGSPPAAGAQIMMDLDFLRGLIEAIDRSGIDSLELQRAGTRVRISKTPATVLTTTTTSAAPVPAAVPVSAPAGASEAAAASDSGGGAPAAAEEPVSNLVEVKSPMVGTFYRAPAPEAPPYVEVGSQVTKGQTLCILEAMKLMNELEAEVEGVVREILVDNADPIEYGQVLFRIEPAGGRA